MEAGRLTLRLAAMNFGVPKSSLSDRVSGRVASGFANVQRQLLIPEGENSLVEYYLYSASHRFPLTKPQIVVDQLFRHCNRLTDQTSDIISPRRASCAMKRPIEEYFRLLSATLEEHGLREKLRQIYSCDEAGFQLNPVRTHAYREARGTRDHITVLACLNAAGEDVPPFYYK